MDESRQERRAKREERGKTNDRGEGRARDSMHPAATARVKAIRERLEELMAERTKLREELVALRGAGAAAGESTTA